MSRVLVSSLAAVAAAALTAAPASAAEIPGPIPIGPNQHFEGLVNGKTDRAIVVTDCFGPGPFRLFGHPRPGQTVKAVLDVQSDGFTGSAARAIEVHFPSPVQPIPVPAPVVLRNYGVPAAIPVSLTVPCFGAGTVQFVPVPTSKTVVTETVNVVFAGLPWVPPTPVPS